MPYILKADRPQYEFALQELVPKLTLKNPGDIVYVIYVILLRLWLREKKFVHLNTIRGILTSTLDEFNRREGQPYEDSKISDPKNGDVE